MKKFLKLLLSISLLSGVSLTAQTNTNQGPTNIAQVNSTLYVGSFSSGVSQYFPTIQSAVSSVCNSSSNELVDIPPSYTGVDTVAGLISGCVRANIKDEHSGFPNICYSYSTGTSSYNQINCSSIIANSISNLELVNSFTVVNGQNCALGSSCNIPINVCAGGSSTCLIEQVNPAPCSTTTSLSAAVTATQTTIPVTSVACLSPVGLAAISNNSPTEFFTWSGISGNTLTGVVRGVWGSTPLAPSASGSIIGQVITGNSLSATLAPYFYTLQNGGSGHGGNIGFPPANTDIYNNSTYFNSAVMSGSGEGGGNFTSLTTGVGTINFTATITAGWGSACGIGIYRWNPASPNSNALPTGSWDAGASDAYCNLSANGLPANSWGLHFVSNGMLGSYGLSVDPAYDLSTQGTITSAGLNIAALSTPSAPSGNLFTTGGSLAAGTYTVSIEALDSFRNHTATGPSTTFTTTGSTSSIALTWPAVAGAASYNVWLSTGQYFDVSYFNAFTLISATGTAGTAPTTNTTGIITTPGIVIPGAPSGSYVKADGSGYGTLSSVGTAGQLQMVGATPGTFAASSATDNGSIFAISDSLTQLGGHVYVPSTTDSTGGQYFINWTANAACNLTAQDNCKIYSDSALTTLAGTDAQWVSSYVIEDTGSVLTASTNLTLPASPGRTYIIQNGTAQTIIVQPNSISIPKYTQVEVVAIGGGFYSISGISNNQFNNINLTDDSTLDIGGGSGTTTGLQRFSLSSGSTGGNISTSCWIANNPNYSFTFGVSDNSGSFCALSSIVAGFEFNQTPYYIKQLGAYYSENEYINPTCTTATTIGNQNSQSIALTDTDTCALTFTQPAAGIEYITLKVVQSATSPYSGQISSSTVNWLGTASSSTPPVIPAVSGAVVLLRCYLDGTNTYCGTVGGGSNIIGLTAGYIPLAGSATTLNANSPIDYGITNTAAITASAPLFIPDYISMGPLNGFIPPSNSICQAAINVVLQDVCLRFNSANLTIEAQQTGTENGFITVAPGGAEGVIIGNGAVAQAVFNPASIQFAPVTSAAYIATIDANGLELPYITSTPSTAPICPNGTGGALTTTGCSSGAVTAVSIANANGISGTSSGGTTPALTIALGAITPSSVAINGGTAITGQTGTGGTVVMSTSPALTNVGITGGTVDGTIIGGTAPAAITGTTITANSTITGLQGVVIPTAGAGPVHNLGFAQTTAATSGANYPSGGLIFTGNYWNGSASATDLWSVLPSYGSGANPTAALTFQYSGSTGTAAVAFPTVEAPHIQASGTVVTLSGTGGTPTCTAGTCLDMRGRLTVPSATTAAVVTFGTAYASAPVCTVTQNGGATFFIPAWSSTTTALTITTGVALTTGEEFDYTCIQ